MRPIVVDEMTESTHSYRTNKGRLILQHDWNAVYREGKGKFWITFHPQDGPRVHSHIECETGQDGVRMITAEDSRFSIQEHSPTRLSVSYTAGNDENISMTFIPPTREFSLDAKHKKVTCLDATSGGLGLSANESSPIIHVWETSTHCIRRTLEGHVGDVYVARFFPSGLVILSAGADTQLKVWSAETGSCAATMTGHKAGVTDVAFVERGRNVLSCSRDGTSRLWDVSQQKTIHSYSPEDSVLNACTVQTTQVVDLDSITPADGEVGTSGKLLVLGSENGGLHGFGLNSREKVFCTTMADKSSVNCITFIDEAALMCGTDAGSVYIYDLRNNSSPIKTWNEGRSVILSAISHKQGLYYSTGDGSVVYLDETMAPSHELSGADCDTVYRVVYAGNEVITSCRDGKIRVYDTS